MANLKEETLAKLEKYGKTLDDIEFAAVKYQPNFDVTVELCNPYGDFNIDKLDIEYDNGYGSQKVGGFIVFTDGTWMERSEYDGAEWWDYRKRPDRDTEVTIW